MRRTLGVCRRLASFAVCMALASASANATPALVMDVASGDVLYSDEATQPWYPASLTKLMTVYVALSAVRDHRISLETPLAVSPRAASMPPSKMGFAPGTQVTLDNALKMLMVRSANDLAITVAEGVSGSVEAFAEDMNGAAAALGLRESHFVNPNGLPNPSHVSSARDMALIARALYREFPEEATLFNLGALQLGTEIITNHNNLLGRYPGVDGMKTGFTCPAGFNVVASAFKDGRRLVTVIMGAPSVAARSAKAAALFDRGFAGIDQPTASVVALPASSSTVPPDMRNDVCRNRARLIARFNAEVQQLDAPLLATVPQGAAGGAAPSFLFNAASAPRPPAMALVINAMHAPQFDPVAVHIGAEPGYTGAVAQARPPHSAIGTEPDPAAAIAYAPALPPLADSPLGIDANALPLKGRGRLLRAARGRKAHAKTAEGPVTKVLNEEDGAKDPTNKGSDADTAAPGRKPIVAKAAVKASEAKGSKQLSTKQASIKPAETPDDEGKQPAGSKPVKGKAAASGKRPASKDKPMLVKAKSKDNAPE